MFFRSLQCEREASYECTRVCVSVWVCQVQCWHRSSCLYWVTYLHESRVGNPCRFPLRSSDPTPTSIKAQVAGLSLLLAASFLPPLFRVFHSQQCAGASWSRMGVTRGCKSCGDWRLVTIQRETCKWIKTQTQTQNQIIFCKCFTKKWKKGQKQWISGQGGLNWVLTINTKCNCEWIIIQITVLDATSTQARNTS